MARIVALRLETILEAPQIPPRAELEGMVRSWIDELHWRQEIRRAATGGYVWFEPDEVEQMGPESSREMETLLKMSHRLFQADEEVRVVQAALGPDGDAAPFGHIVKNAEQFLGVRADTESLAGRLWQRTILRGYATFLEETKATLSRIEQACAAAARAKPKIAEFPFLQYWDGFCVQKQSRRQWKGDTTANQKASGRVFEFLFPGISLRDVIEKTVAPDFKTKLFQLPENYHTSFWKGLTASELIGKAKNPKFPKLRTGTINKHTGSFGGETGYWAFLVENKYVPDDIKNPFAGLHEPMPKGRDARHQRDIWPRHLEAKLFSAPWIRGC